MNFKKWAELAVQKCIYFGNGLDQPSSLQDSFIITGSNFTAKSDNQLNISKKLYTFSTI